jgi:predicted type IV restriction endonuclease
MFRALDWDFENTNEVSPEEHASNGRVDYAFKLNNVSQFYVEAKSLKADLNREDFIKAGGIFNIR